MTLYSRGNCGLCEDAYEIVNDVRRSLASSLATTLDVVDITTDAALLTRYRYDIPVLLVDGRPAFQHRVDPERLRRRLVDGIPAPLEELAPEAKIRMSDIPSNLSKWEPPRALKVSFLFVVVLSFALLFGAKIYTNTVIYQQKMEQAIEAAPAQGVAPTFTLKDATNHEVTLASLRGKVVFLNFWASWCEPCREEMPSLADLARQMDPKDTVFLAVSVDDDWRAVESFIGSEPTPFRVLLDREKAVSGAYGTMQYPESYVIGPDGTLRYKFTGARDWSNVAAIKILEHAGAHRLAMPAAKSMSG